MKNWRMFLKLIFLMMFSPIVYANDYDDKAFKEISKEVGVRERLLRAICWVESSHNRHAYNHGDGSHNDHAFGMCQVLYSTAHSMGLNDPRCLNDFRDVSKADRNYTDGCQLFGPRTNIRYAAKFLKKLVDKYEGNEFEAISAYNLGRYRECRDGWLYYKGERFKPCIIGGPANLYYIRKVQDALSDER